MFCKYYNIKNTSSQEYINLTHLAAEFEELTEENYNKFMDSIDEKTYVKILELLCYKQDMLAKQDLAT